MASFFDSVSKRRHTYVRVITMLAGAFDGDKGDSYTR